MSRISAWYLLFSTGTYGTILWRAIGEGQEQGALRRFLMLAAAGLSILMSAIQVFTKSVADFIIASFALYAATLVLIPLNLDTPFLELCLFLSFLTGVALHHPLPANIVVSVIAHLGMGAALWLALAAGGFEAAEILGVQGKLLLLAGTVVGFAAATVHYREKVLDVRAEAERLDGVVTRLAKSNLQYQQYAREAEATSAESERKRITREIHDVVGYTLTNNITMMEAVTDMMRENPFGVAKLVKLARENAQEGLTRIREALYELRKTEIREQSGLDAVRKMIEVYQRGTGVKVEILLRDMVWSFPPEVESAFYQVIQESLINAFRHGRARTVTLFLSREADAVELRVSDDGIGAEQFTEGIGLTGMRERMASIGGTLEARSSTAGFRVSAVWRRSG